jgi:hypothetical protein
VKCLNKELHLHSAIRRQMYKHAENEIGQLIWKLHRELQLSINSEMRDKIIEVFKS